MNSNNSLTLLKFHAPWCTPCKAMAPIIESVIPEFKDLEVKDIDVDINSDAAFKYEVRSVPMLILLKNGENVNKLIGLRTAEEIRKFISSSMG